MTPQPFKLLQATAAAAAAAATAAAAAVTPKFQPLFW